MAEEQGNTGSFPSITDFYLNVPLYTPHTLTKERIHSIINFPGPLDSFCIECRQSSIFSNPSANKRPRQPMRNQGSLGEIAEFVKLQQRDVFECWFDCTRNSKHKLFFVFRIQWQDGMLMKVGQHPSLADLAMTEVGKYRKLLGPEIYPEFNRAIGLAAHGIGIGAFVYLRRILEGLIEEAHRAAQCANGWNESAYTEAHVDVKIRLLKDYVPPFLVKHRVLYSILSKGIHELSEQECLQAFPIMRLGIELILDQKLEIQERDAKIARASKDITALNSQLKGKRK